MKCIMLSYKIILVIGLFATPGLSLWSCTTNEECSSLAGSVCDAGACICPAGTQAALGGTICAPVAPYHTSPCVEDHQCLRLFTGFECRRPEGSTIGSCSCRPGHHFFFGRCWVTIGYGAQCTRDEQCLSIVRDPFSLACSGTCQCGPGFYERQRGECRRAGLVVGDGCVLDQDCLPSDLACDRRSFTCFNTTATEPPSEVEPEVDPEAEPEVEPEVEETSNVHKMAATETKMAAFQHGAACGVNAPCADPLVCSPFGICVCPIGYYVNDNATVCLAELGSPSTEEQCVGLFSRVINGTCTCPANFFFQENMRDCVKVARYITDSCISDDSCRTFGEATRCGPEGTWGLRFCECVPELAVWDRARSLCRLFAGIGEACEVDSDCLAGELEIQCRLDSEGIGYCACPDGLTEFQGLCITSGLELGDACQVTEECTATNNTVCEGGRCSCDYGYQAVDDFCAPIIGGTCTVDSDCVVQNTVCRNVSNTFTCQCDASFVEYSDTCWPAVSGHEATCNVSAQCHAVLGDSSSCVNSICSCSERHHYRDGGCWPSTGLFESCSRSSQCFLGDITNRVVCRNSLCQCHFDYPYSEELNTCTSSATALTASILVFATILALF